MFHVDISQDCVLRSNFFFFCQSGLIFYLVLDLSKWMLVQAARQHAVNCTSFRQHTGYPYMGYDLTKWFDILMYKLDT